MATRIVDHDAVAIRPTMAMALDKRWNTKHSIEDRKKQKAKKKLFRLAHNFDHS